MVLKKTSRKLAALYEECQSKGRSRIKVDHVEEILAKIDRKRRKIVAALAEATDKADREKLERKLGVIDTQRSRGRELLDLVRADGS